MPLYKMSSSMNRQPTAVRGIYTELFLIDLPGKKYTTLWHGIFKH